MNDGVSVAGWKGVRLVVAVGVWEGVDVTVGVLLAVLVKISGVELNVVVAVIVCVRVGVGVKLPDAGARAMAMNPIQ